MTLWIGIVALALGAVIVLWMPQLRRAPAAVEAIAFDRALYEARMREIDSDLALGRIGPSEAEAARAEEGRKLIGLAAEAPRRAAAGSRISPLLLGVSLFVPVFAFAAYLAIGVPGMPDMAAATRPDRDVSRQSIEQLLERAEAQLARNPSDLRGWTVVAPVYLRLGRAEDAVLAWRNALRLAPDNLDYRLSFAEALTAARDGVVTEEARQAFGAVLAARPAEPKARFYLAIAFGQQGDHARAAALWRHLIADAPAEAPWLPVARAQLEAAESRLAGKTAGPAQDDIDAAANLSAEDRRQMIEGMVAGLAEKLKQDPSDKDGWKRLIRSYSVLGSKDKLAAALAEARKAHAGDATFLAELEAIAAKPDGSGQ